MKKIYFLIICCMMVMVFGCATTKGPRLVKGFAMSDIIYTDASKDVAFNISREVLKNLGYKVKVAEKNCDNFLIKGSHFVFPSPLPYYVQINIDEEVGGAKISYGLDQPGTFPNMDTTGNFSRRFNEIYDEISKTLEAQGYRVQKK